MPSRLLCCSFLNEPPVFLCFYMLLTDLGDMEMGENRVWYCTIFISPISALAILETIK